MTFGDTINLWTRAASARAYVRIIGANRELSWLASEVFLPILSVTAYIFLYRSLGQPPIYEGMVVLGGAMIPFWIVVLWSMAMQLYWEKEMGNLDIYLSSPADPIALLIGMAVGGMFMGGLRTAGILVLGVIFFRVPLTVSSWPLLIAVFSLTLTALFAMGMAASSVYFVTGRKGIKINIALMEPVYMLTGMFYPVRNMGLIVSMIASIIPITLGLDGIRQLTLPGAEALKFLSVPVEIALLAGVTVVFGVLALWLMRRMAEKGRRDGTLTEKWL